MVVHDFGGWHEVSGHHEIEAILAIRHGQGVKEIWLYKGAQRRPAIAILAHRDLACVRYYPNHEHPGFQSVGPAPDLDPEGETAFFVNTPTEELPMPNSTVVPFSSALAVAKEFAKSTKLPRCIEWFQL